jgi:adenine phosphoribosyltransferase
VTTPGSELAERIRASVREIPDFPQRGISFKDITPVLADPNLFETAVLALAECSRKFDVSKVVGIESRGFIFGAPIAMQLDCGFVPIRKPGKLPFRTHRVEYQLEYGLDALEAHIDAFVAGERVLIVDDLLATGGTASAAARLVTQLGGEVVGAAFMIELGFLGGRALLQGIPVQSLLTY